MLYLTNSWDNKREVSVQSVETLWNIFSWQILLTRPQSSISAYHHCLTPVQPSSLYVSLFVFSPRSSPRERRKIHILVVLRHQSFENQRSLKWNMLRAAYHYYYWQLVFIWSRSPQTKLHSWTCWTLAFSTGSNSDLPSQELSWPTL